MKFSDLRLCEFSDSDRFYETCAYCGLMKFTLLFKRANMIHTILRSVPDAAGVKPIVVTQY